MINILVFGTSTAYGAWDPEGGWVARLRRWADEKNISQKLGLSGREIYVYNLGISGDNTAWLLERLEFEAKQRDVEDPGTILVFQIGKNDALLNNQTQKTECAPQKYEDNLAEVIRVAQKYTRKILFVGSLPVDEGKVDPVPWLPTHSYKNEFIAQFESITRSVCMAHKLPFIEVYDPAKDPNCRQLLEDGIHGNAQGHQLMFERVKDYLAESNLLKI